MTADEMTNMVHEALENVFSTIGSATKHRSVNDLCGVITIEYEGQKFEVQIWEMG